MKEHMKKLNFVLLFIVSCFVSATIVMLYLGLAQKISNITVPKLPNISLSDLIKVSRFSLVKAPSQSLVGVITSMNGDVMYEPRLATEAAKISSPTEVQQGEGVSVGEVGSAIITFKDAAEIDINSNSGVDVIQTLPANLVFKQTLGTVSYKKLGTYPVSVRVGHLLIENGGEVKVSFTKDSPLTTVVVIDGSVKIAYNNLYNVSQVKTLSSGATLIFNEANRRVSITTN